MTGLNSLIHSISGHNSSANSGASLETANLNMTSFKPIMMNTLHMVMNASSTMLDLALSDSSMHGNISSLIKGVSSSALLGSSSILPGENITFSSK
jgi:hypothetical protein